MANVISDETIEYVGILSKLELSPEEKERAKKDMEDMLNYIDKLNELDTSGVVTNQDDRENILANAPSEQDGAFTVPRTFD